MGYCDASKLTDISTRPDFKKITAKGGRVKSEAKSRAAKIKGLKMTKPENIERKALTLATNESASALEIMQMIKIINDNFDLKPELKIRLVDSLTKAHTAIHGSKSKNLNINIDYNKKLNEVFEKWQVHNKKLLKERKEIKKLVKN